VAPVETWLLLLYPVAMGLSITFTAILARRFGENLVTTK
jgi:hypothetical protein